MKVLGVPTLAALARYFDIAPQAINAAIRQRRVPEAWIYKVALETGRRVEWLKTGYGAERAGTDDVAPSDEAGLVAQLHSFVRETDAEYASTMMQQLASLDGTEREALQRFLRGLKNDPETRRHLIGQMKIIERALDGREERAEDQTA